MCRRKNNVTIVSNEDGKSALMPRKKCLEG